MNHNDSKKHSDAKSEHHVQGTPSHPQQGSSHDEKGEANKNRQMDKSAPAHGRSQGITTNPDDVGAGGGSVPAGQHGQDSRTWGAHDNQKNVPHDKGGHKADQEDRSRKADGGMASEQVGRGEKVGHKH